MFWHSLLSNWRLTPDYWACYWASGTQKWSCCHCPDLGHDMFLTDPSDHLSTCPAECCGPRRRAQCGLVSSLQAGLFSFSARQIQTVSLPKPLNARKWYLQINPVRPVGPFHFCQVNHETRFKSGWSLEVVMEKRSKWIRPNYFWAGKVWLDF